MTAPAPSAAAPAASLAGVGVTFPNGTQGLRGIDLDVAPGEAVALVGPSGAGKTSLLRVLAGLLEPTVGAARLGGDSVTDLARSRRELPHRVGMVQQRLDLVPQLTVKHNVQAGLLGRWGALTSLAALLLPVEVPGARAAARRLGIEDKFHQRVAYLSGGEQQRVAMARLLVQDPRVVLADEPVASLDPARAEDLLRLLVILGRDADRALVTSLHVPDLARRHFDRIVGLRHGRIVVDLPAAAATRQALAPVYDLAGRGETSTEAIAADREAAR